MSVQKLVGEFGKAAKQKLAVPGGQAEDKLRTPLENLLHGLALEAGLPEDTLALSDEHSLAELRTRPDYAVETNKALTGFIEVKRPGKGADPRQFTDAHDQEQWKKLKSLPNLLYTDGNAFGLWRDGEREGDIVRLEGDIETSGGKLAAPPGLLPLIADFLTWEPIAPKNPEQLAETSARLCRFLRDEVLEQLGNENEALASLKEDWRALLFPDADDPTFADGYAQAVTFGLLMARSRNIELTPDLDEAAKELSETATLIGTALRLLTEQTLRNSPALKTLARVLDKVSWAQVSKGDPEAWINFYENFLSVYDNALRRKTGSYYTPPEVVRAMVRLTDEALRAPGRYGLARGLADPKVHIADPAVGSGTFPLAILRRIAETVEHFDTAGAVGGAVTEAAKRLYGFELQFGPYAVAQLRLTGEATDLLLRQKKAEMLAEGAAGEEVADLKPDKAMLKQASSMVPRLFVADTLADPFADKETGQGIYKEISKSRLAAAQVTREAPITVVIGNPPYKNEAKGKGAWIESGSGNDPALFDDWKPPTEWGIGTHSGHLRNLYVYFWRWAAWKVFEQVGAGAGEQDGIVCYITVAGFLNGPGFQKMRADLRAKCDEIWVIDCSPEGHQPEVATRIFQDVQQPVCIVIASRSPETDEGSPATVRFRALAKGHRTAKFAELAKLALDGKGWADCSPNWRAPFLPARGGSWADFWPLEDVVGYAGPGVKAGRTWVIAPDAQTLRRRWNRLLKEPSAERRGELFENKPSDRNMTKGAKKLGSVHGDLKSLESLLDDLNYESSEKEAEAALKIRPPVRYGFRSFDRQWIIPDSRVIDRHRPTLWKTLSDHQIHLSALMVHSPVAGPSLTATSLLPDQDHYKGSFGGHVFSLYKDAAATEPNISSAVVKALSAAHGSSIRWMCSPMSPASSRIPPSPPPTATIWFAPACVCR